MRTRVLRQAEVEILKRKITQRHAMMLEETHEDVTRARSETYGSVAGPVTDSADRASADVIADLGHAEIARDLREVDELEAALARIDAGNYGYCTQCGVEIEFARLQVYPTATRCAKCQVSHERTFARPGGRRL